MAVLPAELENVPDDFLHQAEGLLDLGLNQRSEVNYSYIHLHTHTYTQQEESIQQRVSTDLKTRLQRVFTWDWKKKKGAKAEQVGVKRKEKMLAKEIQRWTKREKKVEDQHTGIKEKRKGRNSDDAAWLAGKPIPVATVTPVRWTIETEPLSFFPVSGLVTAPPLSFFNTYKPDSL